MAFDGKINDNPLTKFLTTLTNERKIPPLDKWSPSTITPFDIVIDERGDWYHEGHKITRQSLVDLFASVLWAEGEGEQKHYFLKTPTDKYQITVVDTPLFISRVDKTYLNDKEHIVFMTVHGDVLLLDEHVPYFKEFTQDGSSEHRLYVDMRFNLTARINRNVFYHLVEMGELIEEAGRTVLVLISGGNEYRIVSN